MHIFKSAALALCLVSVTAVSTPALADEAGEIKYRKAVMKSIGGHMGAIVGILKGQTGNKANLAAHGRGLAELASITRSVFPAGSDFGETEALPAVWEKPAEFAKAVSMFEAAAKGMETATMSGDMAAVGAALGKLGGACKNCHENFREKKQ
ncbi:cytochrome c [Magnetovibrio sp. PR-2]|uniref:c-type cytochrome n=1 Tax=Magnetovibrio sp. PR-2 TaxID=3120356 RepID=UPI002FCDF5A7